MAPLPSEATAVDNKLVLVLASAVAVPTWPILADKALKPPAREPASLNVLIAPDTLPMPLTRLPKPLVKPPMIPRPPPSNLRAGPAAAPIKPHLIMFCCCSDDILLNFSAISDRVFNHGLAASSPLFRAFSNGPPNSIAISVILFLKIFNCDSVVSYRLRASSVSALFFSHALFERFTASVIVSDADARDLSIFPCRIPVIPSSSRIPSMFLPSSLAFCNPLIKDCKACAGFSFQALVNCSEVIPAV